MVNQEINFLSNIANCRQFRLDDWRYRTYWFLVVVLVAGYTHRSDKQYGYKKKKFAVHASIDTHFNPFVGIATPNSLPANCLIGQHPQASRPTFVMPQQRGAYPPLDVIITRSSLGDVPISKSNVLKG
jgi:hypothetical protein